MKAQPSPAQADRAGRHQHDLAAILLQPRDGSGDRFEMFGVKLPVAPGHDAGAQLDYRAPRRAQPLRYGFLRSAMIISNPWRI